MNFRTLDLNLLRVFDVVMVERNVTRAAQRLSMTQPAASNALRRLREALGEDLFVPGPSGVTPTRYAASLWPAVRDALQSLQAAIAPAGFDARRDAREFTLAMADATAAVLLPVLMHLWSDARAAATLRVVGLDSRDPRPLLEQGGADAAVGFFPDVARDLAAEGGSGVIRLDELYECDYVCVMRRGHALADKPLALDDYCAAQHLRVNFAGRPRGYVDEALARLGRERRVLLTVDHFSTAGCLVHNSELLTVLPRSFVAATGYASQLATAALPFEMPRIDVGLLWHRRYERDAGQRWLREMVAQAALRVAARLQQPARLEPAGEHAEALTS